LKKQLGEMVKSLGEAQNLLLQLEERNDVQAIDISRIEVANSELQEKLKRRENLLEKHNQLLRTQTIQHKAVVDNVNFNYDDESHI